jgi:hypothetical protein
VIKEKKMKLNQIDLLQLMFVYLRLTGAIEWPWIVVLLPEIIRFVLRAVITGMQSARPEGKLSKWIEKLR